MNQVQTIFKNFSWLMVSQIITSICAFVWTILIARYLGVSDYGIMSFAISLTGIAAILMDMGISTHIIRHVATDYDSSSKYLGNAIPLKLVFSIFTFILILIALILMKCDILTIQITLLFTIEQIFKSIIILFNGSLQAVEEGKYQAIGNILLNLILLIFIIISIVYDFGLYGITLSYVFANSFVMITQYFAVKKKLSKPNFEFDREFCKKITLYSIPFALSSFFAIILYSIDMVMLTNMVSSYANGIYSAAYKITSIFVTLYGVYSAVVYPVMSRFYKNDKNLLIISFEKSVKYLMMLFIPLSFSMIVYSGDIIVLFFGKEFIAAESSLSILMWTVSLTIISGVCANLLNASHKEKHVTLILMACAIFNIIANILIIPKYSYIGAAFTTISGDLIGVCLMIYSIYKINALPNKKIVLDLFKILIGSIILFVSLLVLNLNMWLAIPVGIIIYFGTIIILKTFDDDDKYIIKEILSKN